jgi:hypothetical protein
MQMMKSYKNIIAPFAFAALLASFPGVAHAQAEAAAATAAEMVASKVVQAVTAKKDPPGTNWLAAQVIHADARSMIVQEQANPKMIHTFSYGPELKNAMQGLENGNGSYRYGDKIKILYQQQQPGQFVALRIKGKPS